MMHQMNRSVGRRERVLVAGNDGQIMVCTASAGTDWLKNTSATRRRPLVLAGIRDFLQARLPGGTIC
jgi:hypothetical protein